MTSIAMVGPVLVTGASGKIGTEIVRGFVAHGIDVVALSRQERESFPRNEQGGGLAWIRGDLTAYDGVPNILSELARRNILPTAIVHSARSLNNLSARGSRWPSSVQWHAELELAVISASDLVTGVAAIPESRLKSAVLLSSMYGVVAVNQGLYADATSAAPMHYSVMRAATNHLARELGVRLAPSVRVNALAFGGVRGRANPDFEARYAALNPSGRMLDAVDLFGPVAYLASDASSGMTGQVMAVDGGWTAW